MHTIHSKTKICTIFLLVMMQFYSQYAFSKSTHNKTKEIKIVQVLPWNTKSNSDLVGEKVDERSRFAKKFKKKDGGIRMFTSTVPLHYKAGSVWEEINCKIISNHGKHAAELPYCNESNIFKTYYPNNPIAENIITLLKEGQLSENIEAFYAIDANGNSVYTYPFYVTPSIDIQDEKIIYKDLFPNISVSYTQQISGRKFDIELKNLQTIDQIPHEAKFLVLKESLLLPKGWSITKSNDRYAIYDGKVHIANLPTPQAYEKNADLSQDENPRSTMHKGILEIEGIENRITIYSKFSIDWLKDASRKFPIILDPLINFYPDNNLYATGRILTAGGPKNTGSLRLANSTSAICWAKFNISSLPANITITSAAYYGNHYVGTGVGSGKIANIIGMQNIDPEIVSSTSNVINTQINGGGPVYSNNYIFGNNILDWRMGTLGGNALNDIAMQQSQGWTALGFSYNSGSTGTMLQRGADAYSSNPAFLPYLALDYSINASAGVPTISEWGLIILALLLLASGMYMIAVRKKKKIHSFK